MTLKGWAIEADTLERYMQIAEDTKKEFVYEKATGKWCWYNRSDPVSGRDCSRRFNTFWAAICDAVSPYVDEVPGQVEITVDTGGTTPEDMKQGVLRVDAEVSVRPEVISFDKIGSIMTLRLSNGKYVSFDANSMAKLVAKTKDDLSEKMLSALRAWEAFTEEAKIVPPWESAGDKWAQMMQKPVRLTKEALGASSTTAPEKIPVAPTVVEAGPKSKPSVIIEGVSDLESLKIYHDRAQLLADFLGMNVVLTSKGSREELVLISGDRKIRIEAFVNRYDCGTLNIEKVK
jgi:hypothetical protein